jgi:hypothetical protein
LEEIKERAEHVRRSDQHVRRRNERGRLENETARGSTFTILTKRFVWKKGGKRRNPLTLRHLQAAGQCVRPRFDGPCDERYDAGLRVKLLILPMLAGIVAFLFRFITHGTFSNDHYVHLSLAQAVLLGDWPIRDYTEVGAPFMVALSAAAQTIFGQELFAELMLTVISLGVAAAVTCWAAARLTGSQTLGFLAALAQIVAFPRLYGYLKITLYPILFVIGWAYLRRPNGKRLAALGAWTAFAFLLRHDHGVYSAIGGGAAVIIAHWSEGPRRVLQRAAAYAGLVLLCVSPYLAYVQLNVGLVEYFRTGLQVSRTEAQRGDWNLPRFVPVQSGPIVLTKPRSADDLPAIAVRWRMGLSDDDRHAHERSLGLLYPELRDDGQSWRYRVEPPATEALSQLVRLPDAADTGGFDRSSLRLENGPRGLHRIAVALNLDRIAPGPPLEDLFGAVNSTTLLFYTVWLLPAVTLVLWLVRHRSCRPPLRCGPEVLLLAAVAMPTIAGLVRSPTDVRIPDAFGTAPILAVWVIAATFSARPRAAAARAAVKVLAVAAGITLAIAVASMASLREKIDEADLREDSSVILERAHGIIERTRTWPWTGEWPAGGGSELVPYLNRCTDQQDRLLVMWNAPQFNVFSRRAFAGGETLLVPLFRPTATYEPAVLERLRRQSVPIVLADRDQLPEFEKAYAAISMYLSKRYRQAGVFPQDGGQQIIVFVDRERRQSGTDLELNLPCFGDGQHALNR